MPVSNRASRAAAVSAPSPAHRRAGAHAWRAGSSSGAGHTVRAVRRRVAQPSPPAAAASLSSSAGGVVQGRVVALLPAQ